MKTRYTLCAAFTGILLLAATNSCKKPDEGVDLIIETGFSEATVSFQFVDAVTGEQLGLTSGSAVVEVEVDGPDKSYIVDNASGSTFNTEGGFITLAVEHGVTPSSSNVIDFHLNAEAPGYLPRTTVVRISEPGTQHYVIEMVKVTDTPDGVGAATNNALTANSSGTTASSLSLSTPALNTTFENTGAEFTVPAGTTLLDANNTPVTGTIATTLVYFNNQDNSAMSAYPTGASGQMAGNDDLFATGAVVSAQMRGNGKEVKNFGSSVQMRIELPAATENGDGQPISNGMLAPVWSLDPTTGEWVEESQTTIQFNSTSGKYEAIFNMTHLSYWMIAWPLTSCTSGSTFTFSTPYASAKSGVVVLKSGGGRTIAGGTVSIMNGAQYQLLKAPTFGAPFQITVFPDYYSYTANIGGQSTSIASLCAGNYTINYSAPVTPTTVTVNVNGTCADKPGRIIRPTVTVYARKSSTTNWFYVGEMVNGHITTSALNMSESYKIGVFLGGQFIQSDGEYTVDQLEYTLDEVIDPYICNLIN